MATITIEVPDELSELIASVGDRLPELLADTIRRPVLPASVYRHVLDFLAGDPSAEEVAAFGPTPEMVERLRVLVAREAAGEATPEEKAELDEYERLEHLMIIIKAGGLRRRAGSG